MHHAMNGIDHNHDYWLIKMLNGSHQFRKLFLIHEIYGFRQDKQRNIFFNRFMFFPRLPALAKATYSFGSNVQYRALFCAKSVPRPAI